MGRDLAVSHAPIENLGRKSIPKKYMQDNTKFFIGGIVIAIIIAGVFLSAKDDSFSGASGLSAKQVIATSTSVGPQENIQIFANKNTSCSSRVISTKASPISITFDDPSNGDIASTTLTSMVGFYQSASTTVAYDAELYGCGRWFAHSTASSSITVAEF